MAQTSGTSILERPVLAAGVGRGQAGLKVLSSDEHVDPTRLAAIGYCFGGSTALQLAYNGADLKAVCTFHAAVPVPEGEQAQAIKEMYSEMDDGTIAGRKSVMVALKLYLDFINLFLFLLRLMGDRR